MSKWISIKDRLPEECESVLIYSPGFPVTGAYLIYETTMKRHFPICWQVNDWDESDTTHRWNEISHWMPLPELPK